MLQRLHTVVAQHLKKGRLRLYGRHNGGQRVDQALAEGLKGRGHGLGRPSVLLKARL